MRARPVITVAGDAKVRIDVEVEYNPRIKMANSNFCFTYQISIDNIGKLTVRLLTRKWKITDGDAKVQEIQGEGVIGQQPSIAPGYGFSYISYVDLPTPAGVMEGSFLMQPSDDEPFIAAIPMFSLQAMDLLH